MEFASDYSPEISARLSRQSRIHSSLIVGSGVISFELGVIVWMIMPIYDYYALSPDSQNRKIRLPFPGLYPELDPVEHFWVILAHQFIIATITSVVIALSFSFPASLCVLVQGQVKVLTESLTVPENSEVKSRLILSELGRKFQTVKVEENGGERISGESSHRTPVSLRNCIQHHQKILRYVKKL